MSKDMKIRTFSHNFVRLGDIGAIINKTGEAFFGIRPWQSVWALSGACDYQTLRNLVERREPR